jgi:hypothetical protein
MMNFVNYYFSGTSYVRGESLDDLNGLLIYPNHPTHFGRFTFSRHMANERPLQTYSYPSRQNCLVYTGSQHRVGSVLHTLIAPLPPAKSLAFGCGAMLRFSESPFLLAGVFFRMAFLVVIKRLLANLNMLYQNPSFSLLDFLPYQRLRSVLILRICCMPSAYLSTADVTKALSTGCAYMYPRGTSNGIAVRGIS